jgi:aspartyl-tRNA(Asn)/glutamyl-tRNA(Gln) amidotransferase subunit A
VTGMLRGGDYAYLSASAARAALASGSFSAVEYVSALLDRIQQANEHSHAFISTSPERALRFARRADQRRTLGLPLPPLHGVPFAIKDLIDVRGLPTSAQSRCSTPAASRTAAAVLQLQRHGGIYIGKLALEEFGIGSPFDDLAWPSPKNPWDPHRTTGGSSSGSAVALAEGLVPLALGTDTAGSVRAPAAYCGLVALKPSDRRVNMRGVRPLAPTLDTIGPMARSAEDCALMFSCLTSLKRQMTSDRVNLGFVDTSCSGLTIDRDVADALAAAVKVFESLGSHIGEAALPLLTRSREIGDTILKHEAYAVHRERLAQEGHLYGDTCRRRLIAGAHVSPGTYAAALGAREQIKAHVDQLLECFDVLAMPVTFGAAARLDDSAGLRRSDDVLFRIIFNVAGHPAIAFCTGFNPDGLPLSMQLVGRRGEDEYLLALAIAYQQVTRWHETHPPNPLRRSEMTRRF